MIDFNQIKNGIANACLEQNITKLTHFISLENANVEFPKKADFVLQLKKLFNRSDSNLNQEWSFQTREMTLDSGEIIEFYDFYSSRSKFPELSIYYAIRKGQLIVDIMPF